MDANKSKAAGDCWRKGSEAMAKENWDYSIKMFGQAARWVPDNLMYRQALRGVEGRKYNGNKTGAKMAVVKLMGIRGKVKKAKMQKDWQAVDQAAEDGLTINPWDAQLNADIGEACRNLGFGEVAVFAYEKAIEGDPENKRFNKALAELLEQRGEYRAAGNIWEKIKKIDPLDGEARSKATQLQASSVLDRGGYEGADSTKDAMADHEIAKRLKTSKPGEADGPGMSEEADLQRAVRKEPDKKEPFLKLGDFYRRDGKLKEAKEALEKALELSGGEAAIREQVEDIELDQMWKKLETAKENAAKNPEDEILKKKKSTLAIELIRREMEVFKQRIEQYPADLRLKFDLGQRYMRVKKFAQAIPLIQQCVQDNRLEVRALAALGECFIAEKKGTLARRQYEKAVPKLNQHDDANLFLDVHYRLGRLCDEAGDMAAAEDHYGEVLVVDYDYKDARSRLENLQGG